MTEEDGTPGGPRYWDYWPQHFDYVYLLFTEPGDPNPIPTGSNSSMRATASSLQGHPARAAALGTRRSDCIASDGSRVSFHEFRGRFTESDWFDPLGSPSKCHRPVMKA